MTLNKNKTYYDITHATEMNSDSQGGEISWSEKLGCWTSNIYDYILSDEELLEGLADGWAAETI